MVFFKGNIEIFPNINTRTFFSGEVGDGGIECLENLYKNYKLKINGNKFSTNYNTTKGLNQRLKDVFKDKTYY